MDERSTMRSLFAPRCQQSTRGFYTCAEPGESISCRPALLNHRWFIPSPGPTLAPESDWEAGHLLFINRIWETPRFNVVRSNGSSSLWLRRIALNNAEAVLRSASCVKNWALHPPKLTPLIVPLLLLVISFVLVTLYSGVAEGAMEIHFCDWWSKYILLHIVSFRLQKKPLKISLVLKRDPEAEIQALW